MTNIVLFDGECNFCNQSIQFIIKRIITLTFNMHHYKDASEDNY